ncbi:hypothetical protein F5Y19DRAFT_411748 [Xylariaceae sp. FL1651]|nr:hypothetical protein F5Y19DRAFT_411748 [Xylariaceae sp. FL1651]
MLRRCSAYLQFSDTAHFVAWLILCGVLATFSFTHLRFIDFYGVFCRAAGRIPGQGALPGECFYFTQSKSANVGIRLHLSLILPAALLACLQFVPRIRHKTAIAHRIGGYATLILSIVGAVSVAPTIRHAFGGDVAAQAAAGVMTLLFVGAQLKAYVSIKQLQIDRHQAWMMRSWVYAAGIISLRVIMPIAAIIVSILGDYYMAQPCDKIDFVLRDKNQVLDRYPGCTSFYSGENYKQHVAVRADIASPDVVQILTAFNITYGMSSWVAIMIHVVGIELYLRSVAPKIGLERKTTTNDNKSQAAVSRHDIIERSQKKEK